MKQSTLVCQKLVQTCGDRYFPQTILLHLFFFFNLIFLSYFPFFFWKGDGNCPRQLWLFQPDMLEAVLGCHWLIIGVFICRKGCSLFPFPLFFCSLLLLSTLLAISLYFLSLQLLGTLPSLCLSVSVCILVLVGTENGQMGWEWYWKPGSLEYQSSCNSSLCCSGQIAAYVCIAQYCR